MSVYFRKNAFKVAKKKTLRINKQINIRNRGIVQYWHTPRPPCAKTPYKTAPKPTITDDTIHSDDAPTKLPSTIYIHGVYVSI